MTWQAAFLDAGGTLFRPYDTVGAIYAEAALGFGVRTDPQEMERAFQKEWHLAGGLRTLRARDVAQERAWWRAFVERVFQRVGRVPEEDEFFDELFDRFASSECWLLYPDTLPALKALGEGGRRIGIVSNWDSRLLRICQELGISAHVDFVLSSVQVGAAKPQAIIFEQALARCGVPREHVIHVGDSIEEDVEGARAAGIQPVLILREAAPAQQKPPQGVPCIRSLMELVEKPLEHARSAAE